jgi:hypothetical protein
VDDPLARRLRFERAEVEAADIESPLPMAPIAPSRSVENVDGRAGHSILDRDKDPSRAREDDAHGERVPRRIQRLHGEGRLPSALAKVRDASLQGGEAAGLDGNSSAGGVVACPDEGAEGSLLCARGPVAEGDQLFVACAEEAVQGTLRAEELAVGPALRRLDSHPDRDDHLSAEVAAHVTESRDRGSSQ